MTSEHNVKEGEILEYPEKNTQSQIEIDKAQLTCRVWGQSWVAEVGGMCDELYANLTPPKRLVLWHITKFLCYIQFLQ